MISFLLATVKIMVAGRPVDWAAIKVQPGPGTQQGAAAVIRRRCRGPNLGTNLPGRLVCVCVSGSFKGSVAERSVTRTDGLAGGSPS